MPKDAQRLGQRSRGRRKRSRARAPYACAGGGEPLRAAPEEGWTKSKPRPEEWYAIVGLGGNGELASLGPGAVVRVYASKKEALEALVAIGDAYNRRTGTRVFECAGPTDAAAKGIVDVALVAKQTPIAVLPVLICGDLSNGGF